MIYFNNYIIISLVFSYISFFINKKESLYYLIQALVLSVGLLVVYFVVRNNVDYPFFPSMPLISLFFEWYGATTSGVDANLGELYMYDFVVITPIALVHINEIISILLLIFIINKRNKLKLFDFKLMNVFSFSKRNISFIALFFLLNNMGRTTSLFDPYCHLISFYSTYESFTDSAFKDFFILNIWFISGSFISIILFPYCLYLLLEAKKFSSLFLLILFRFTLLVHHELTVNSIITILSYTFAIFIFKKYNDKVLFLQILILPNLLSFLFSLSLYGLSFLGLA